MLHVVPAYRPSRLRRPIGFVVRRPGARDVRVVGDFVGWQLPGVGLEETAPGVFRGELLLGTGAYEYRLLVDGEWEGHPDAVRSVPNPYGSENAVLEVVPH